MQISKSRFLLGLVLSLVISAVPAFAQNQPPSTQPSPQNPVITPQQDPRLAPLPRVPSTTEQKQTTQQGQRVVANKPMTNSADQAIATMLSICNQKESQLGVIAKQHSEHAKVKEFAEMMTKDHTQMASTLQRFGAQTGLVATTPAGAGASNPALTADSDKENPAQPNSLNAATSLPGSSGLDFVSIHRQIAQQCLSEAEREWSSKKSSECDMGYVGAQIVAHKEMIVSAKVLRQYASPELQKAIDQGVQTAETHLSHAKQLIDTLAKEEHERIAKK
jgi:predicted outer membrane protein